MRVEIDKQRCMGAGLCALAAPEVFTQDDEGESALLPGHADGTDDPLVHAAARGCPVQAIKVIESAQATVET
jgi:ferredoxin